MSEVVKKPVQITETILRDAHQSLIATRMTTDEMLPAVPMLDEIGYRAVECWGGATFDAALRFLHEDPWVRLRKFKDGFKKTKLQMLFRGQNILGYRHYADDVVEYFVQKSIANGIDIIRIFDCFNDLLEKYHPAYLFHGHVHREYGDFVRQRSHPSGTQIINGYGHCIIDIPETAYPKEGATGSFFYDWYITEKKKHHW